MLKNRRSQKGQAVSSEYVVAGVLVIAAFMAMSVYVRRGIQAGVYDTQRKVMRDASNALGNKISLEYEPYYAVSYANVDTYQADSSHLSGGGVYNKVVNFERGSLSTSKQLQPGAAY